MIQKIIETHVIKHMWEAYALKMMASNPNLFGKAHNKIRNFYIYERNHGLKKEILNYTVFRKVVEQFLGKAKKAIISNEAININQCGRICAKRVERDFRKKGQKKVNWKKTMAQGQVWNEEKQKMVYKTIVYFTDQDWCRIAWYKSRIPNDSVYEFVPTYPNKTYNTGFKAEFKKALDENKFLKYNYLFAPIKDYHVDDKTDKTCNTQAQV